MQSWEVALMLPQLALIPLNITYKLMIFILLKADWRWDVYLATDLMFSTLLKHTRPLSLT